MPSTKRKQKSGKIIYKPVLQLPRLPEDQLQGLWASIAVHGVLVPIITDGGSPCRQIIDASHRKEIADEMGYDCPEIILFFFLMPTLAHLDFDLLDRSA